jgi:hypothetical protein
LDFLSNEGTSAQGRGQYIELFLRVRSKTIVRKNLIRKVAPSAPFGHSAREEFSAPFYDRSDLENLSKKQQRGT